MIQAKVLLASLALLAMASACSANLCHRKKGWFEHTCAGTDVAHSDPMCETNLARCNEAQTAAFRAYVECLEAQNQCSLDIVAGCAAAHPAGVNLMCNG